jgi:antitoxin HigA-1
VTHENARSTHPGEIIRALCLEPLGLTVTEAATGLDVSRKTLSALLNGRAGISPEMTVRLSIAFGTSAESWMNQQIHYDLWHAERRRKELKVVRLAAWRSSAKAELLVRCMDAPPFRWRKPLKWSVWPRGRSSVYAGARVQIVESAELRFDIGLSQSVRYGGIVAYVTSVEWCMKRIEPLD